jgi:hypothetical protein
VFCGAKIGERTRNKEQGTKILMGREEGEREERGAFLTFERFGQMNFFTNLR